MHGPMNVKFKY